MRAKPLLFALGILALIAICAVLWHRGSPEYCESWPIYDRYKRYPAGDRMGWKEGEDMMGKIRNENELIEFAKRTGIPFWKVDFENRILVYCYRSPILAIDYYPNWFGAFEGYGMGFVSLGQPEQEDVWWFAEIRKGKISLKFR